jgi:8-oxo-dGTP pyrophosphatase MutT (NUDIX family)
MPPLQKRRRATAIIEYPQGLLLAKMRTMAAMLPGGGVHPGESDEHAVIREVAEETGLRVQRAHLLFEYESFAHTHAVFWVVAPGEPRPCQEVDQLLYYDPQSPAQVSPETRSILAAFYRYRAANGAALEALGGPAA